VNLNSKNPRLRFYGYIDLTDHKCYKLFAAYYQGRHAVALILRDKNY